MAKFHDHDQENIQWEDNVVYLCMKGQMDDASTWTNFNTIERYFLCSFILFFFFIQAKNVKISAI